MTEHIQRRRPHTAWLILVVLLASLYAILSQAALAQRDTPTDIQLRETTPPVFDGRRETQLRDAFRQLHLRFETNIGQTNPEVKFLSRQRGFNLFLTDRDAVMVLTRPSAGQVSDGSIPFLRLTWIGGNTKARMEGIDELQVKSNYFLGNNETHWQTDIPNYGSVQYHDIYAGVDLVYYGKHGQLEYDLIVQPGARADAIHLGIQGASKISLDADGNLIVNLGREQLQLHKPIIYQPARSSYGSEIAETTGRGQRSLAMNLKSIDGRYVLEGDHEVGFDVGKYDHTRPLIIDPQLTYSSYVGGGGNDVIQKVAIDSKGNAYTIGYSKSLDFPLAVPFQGQLSGVNNVVISKLNPDLPGAASLIYSSYLGGSADSVGRGIAVDSQGQIYIVGDTSAPSFPVTSGAYRTACRMQAGQCSTDVFAAKLNASGNRLLYSTYLGGTGTEFAFALAIDAVGHLFLTGPTDSSDLPVTSGAFQASLAGGPSKFGDAFVAEINPAGGGTNDLRYLTYLGGSGSEQSWGIAVDHLGAILITGSTASNDFPVTSSNAYQTAYSGSGNLQLGDAFIARINPAGQGRGDLIYSTYLGGNNDDRGESIAVDASSLVYVTGFTSSSAFPVTQSTAYQTTFGAGDCLGSPCGDAFIAKLDTSARGASSLVYSTFFGGNSFDLGHAIALDDFGRVYVAGETASTNFPLANAIQDTCAAGCSPIPMDDVFVAKFDLTRAKTAGLLFSTYLGGNDVDTAWGLAADSAGNAYVVGQVFSKDFPTVLSFQAFCSDCTSFTANPRSGDGFLFKLGTEASVQVGYAKATILVIVACVLALGVSSFRSWSRIQK
jgi:hypothetical protein